MGVQHIAIDRTIDDFSDYITLDKDLGDMYLLPREYRVKWGPPCPCSDGSWVYNDLCNQFKFRSWRGVLDTTLCDKVFLVTCDRSVFCSGYSDFFHQ